LFHLRFLPRLGSVLNAAMSRITIDWIVFIVAIGFIAGIFRLTRGGRSAGSSS